MKKYNLVICVFITSILAAACGSARQSVRNDAFPAGLRQKIESRDFVIEILFSGGDVSAFGGVEGASRIHLRSVNIHGDSLISNDGMFGPEPEFFNQYGGLPFPQGIKPNQKFIYKIDDYKIKNGTRNTIEVTFSHEIWSDVKRKLIPRFYRIVIYKKGFVNIYIHDKAHSILGKIQGLEEMQRN